MIPESQFIYFVTIYCCTFAITALRACLTVFLIILSWTMSNTITHLMSGMQKVAPEHRICPGHVKAVQFASSSPVGQSMTPSHSLREGIQYDE